MLLSMLCFFCLSLIVLSASSYVAVFDIPCGDVPALIVQH